MTSVGEVMEKKESPFAVVGSVYRYSHYGKQYGGSSEKLKIELPYDPAIPLLGIYPKNSKMLIHKDILLLALKARVCVT